MVGLQTQAATVGDNPIDSAMVDGRVEILKSESIARAVIKDLRLVDRRVYWKRADYLAESATLFPDLSESRPSDTQLQRTAFRASPNLTIKRVGLSYVIEI
jgi:succinoglycan biosynthesis transport protein ExoP